MHECIHASLHRCMSYACRLSHLHIRLHIRINSQIYIKERGKTSHREVWGHFFCLLLPSLFYRVAEVQRCNGSQKRPFHFRCKNHASEGDANGGEEFCLVKVARNRKATISFSLRQRTSFLIRKCQDDFQRSTTQESFRSLRN